MEPVDLDKLDALREAASPGEWRYEPARVVYDGSGEGGDIYAEGDNEYFPSVAGTYDYEQGGIIYHANGEAIVALHNAYPAMAAELRALRAENAAHKDGAS